MVLPGEEKEAKASLARRNRPLTSVLRRGNRPVCLGFLLLLIYARPLSAHAVLVRSTPKAHETVASGELNVELQFNSRIDAARSSLSLVLPDGQTKDLAQLPQSSPAVLDAKTQRLAPGSYVLRWQVLAHDGHITRGEVPFDVK
jgi:methionine-rich copper-binding protein CopC